MDYTFILPMAAVVLSAIVLLQSVKKLLKRQQEEKYLIDVLKEKAELINQIKKYEREAESIRRNDSHSLEVLRKELLKEIDAEVYSVSKKHQKKLNVTHQVVKEANQKEKLRYSDKLLSIIEMDLAH